MQSRKSLGIAHGRRVNDHIFEAVQFQVAIDVRDQFGCRLESMHATGGSDPMSGDERELADVGPNVEDGHARGEQSGESAESSPTRLEAFRGE